MNRLRKLVHALDLWLYRRANRRKILITAGYVLGRHHERLAAEERGKDWEARIGWPTGATDPVKAWDGDPDDSGEGC